MTVTFFRCFLETWVGKKTMWAAISNSLVFLLGCAVIMMFGYLTILHFMLIRDNATCSERLGKKDK